MWLWLLALVTCDGWKVTHGTGHLTCETWHVTAVMWILIFLLPNILFYSSLFWIFCIGATIHKRWEIQCLQYADLKKGVSRILCLTRTIQLSLFRNYGGWTVLHFKDIAAYVDWMGQRDDSMKVLDKHWNWINFQLYIYYIYIIYKILEVARN